jgi:type IV pilus assembly protein PilQ
LATEDLNTSFSFGIGDTFVQNDRGSAILNFGTTNPQPERNRQAPNPPGFARRFLSRLQAQVQSGNAKILTDPTLTVQEGQTAQVNLTQEVPAGTEIQYVTANQGGNAIPVQRVVVKDAGLTVVLRIERIDDNGFVTLSVAPTVSAPTQTIDTGLGDVTLLNERSLTSGQIRLRDGQTLILSGIIQDSDRTAVSKIPILGDIPILGALFRSTTRNNQRQEVLVLLTPQIIDDSERSSSMGYNYTPSPDVRQMLERNRGLKTPSNNR